MKLTKKQAALCNNKKLSELFEQEKGNEPNWIGKNACQVIEDVILATISQAKGLDNTTVLNALKHVQIERYKGTFMYELRALVLSDLSLINRKISA